MPAVSVCDPIASAIRHSLETGHSKSILSSDDLSASLTCSATRILQTEIPYEETDGYRSTVLDHLKAKYIVLSLPNSLEQTESSKGLTQKKKLLKEMGPSLPEPIVTLYPADKINLGWKGTFPVGAGMYNVGNTCYLNSTLQALFHVPALVNWLLSDSHHTSKCEQNDGGGECLTCAVAKTLQFSHEKSGSAIKPFYICNKLKLICRTMVPGQQEDAHEFLRYLLEGMERAYLARHRATKLDSYSKETTPVNQIFGGYIRTEVKCLQCRHVSTTFQHFQDLLVDIRKASTLDEALQSYFSREELDNNDYKCEACKRRVPATKQFSLERPPKVLCVQLKRFSVLGGKISRHIGFKQTVDMGPYLRREPGEPARHLNYKLMSMVTHMGPSVNCGHYTAVAQVSTGQYYSFDDSCVRSINLGNVLNTNAYIMMFEMESTSQNANFASQSSKLNGAITKTIATNGIIAKSPLKSISSVIPSNSCEVTNGLTKKLVESSDSGVMAISKTSNANVNSPNKSTKFIGPQLPSRHLEKSQPRLVMHIKNDKVLNNASSLVPYDGSSDDDDTTANFATTLKSPESQNSTVMKHCTGNGTNTLSKINPIKETSKLLISSKESSSKNSKNGLTSNSGNLKHSGQTAVNSKTQNGSITSATISATTPLTITTTTTSTTTATTASNTDNGVTNNLTKHQNGKIETNGRNGEANGKDKLHPIRVKTCIASDDRIFTKAAASSINGWQVSKDAPSPTSGSTPNGWSVTDNKEGKSLNSNTNAQTMSAAAPRNFNGTNRSETVSHLLKMSNRGYGTSSVPNWNGNRSHLGREVDNERREGRKRHLDPDEDEIDRGRIKKIKTRGYETERSNPGYNPFQEYHNSKTWNRSSGGCFHRQRRFYDTSSGGGNRSRYNVGSYKPQQKHRHYNHSRDYWQRR
ncbi:ubiquitin carboxyl-terminal hydrolase 36 [Venturia canescens]|uniref:ubiquitin carboxyl-terminal hydrolase 36 n=1 Tax=Venturia canescens TaxID=32260 RepID=UPI001C9CEA0C|nr:ubiquitin carboxyl-terminal hydrolase 36 [Venturia canescens]XP_043274582.1 ubiquitin carboxyl-terminal hydrolase 36 [Venturia canescens]